MAYAEIVFSDKQQLALLGFAISDKKIFEASTDFGVTPEWFVNPNALKIWKELLAFYDEMRRVPLIEELKSRPTFVKEDQRVRDACNRTLEAALAARADIGYDTLVTAMREWSVARSMRDAIEKTVDFWNRGDINLALNQFRNGYSDIEKIDQKTLSARCQDAHSRVQGEREERLRQAEHILTYGVTYLDDATGGILPNDLVLIGAKTGAGKTQLVTRIASVNATEGKRVVLFALEAEENEIERRLKYGLLAKAYGVWVRQNPGNHRAIDYSLWRLGKLEAELGRFDVGVEKRMEAYKTLSTVYRKGGDYGIEELERDIMRVQAETDLIIIDHLHYIDIGSEDENAGMKKIVKKLRDLAIGLGKPIVLVAHMRKDQFRGKYTPLMPALEDFHGSSDIIKIATTAIILAPCFDADFKRPEQLATMDNTWATYFRISKCRLDGSRLRYTGVCWFDTVTGIYRRPYAVGKLAGNDTVWMPMEWERRPHWSTENAVVDLQPSNFRDQLQRARRGQKEPAAT